jgi:hypothetical protein
MEIVDAIIKLNKLFKTNNWSEKDVDEYVFDSFCKLLENFDSSQRALIVELAGRYSWISYNDYQSGIIHAMNLVDENELSVIKRIFLFPILKPSDEGKIKSGHNLIYIIKAVKRLLGKYGHIKFEILSQFDQLAEGNFSIADTERLFLIDDYLGSGETVEECLAEVQKNPLIESGKLKVICIACQNEIFDSLNANGIATHSSTISKRGISDFNSTNEAAQKIKIMLDIESYIPGGKFYSLGYNQSEALITMMRTPDNTFPIFWKKHRKEGKYYNAPFSREEVVE